METTVNDDLYTIADLESYIDHAQEFALRFGLKSEGIEFLYCTAKHLQEYKGYWGMPRQYPSWRWGKAIELDRTLERHGIGNSYIYEMIAMMNPMRALLRRENSKMATLLVILHCFGHEDFARSNTYWEVMGIDGVRRRLRYADERVRAIREEKGIEYVNRVLDAAVALAPQGRRNFLLRDMYKARSDKKDERLKPNNKNPVEDLDRFILTLTDLEDEERELIQIAMDQELYFTPIGQCQMLNEGWASTVQHFGLRDFSEHEIIGFNDFTKSMQLHNNVVKPHLGGGLNPYHIGFQLYRAMRIWYDGSINLSLLHDESERRFFEAMKADYRENENTPEDTGKLTGKEKMFEIRAGDRDTTALRKYLTYPMLKEMRVFDFIGSLDGETLQVIKQVNPENWLEARNLLLSLAGENRVPDVRVVDDNYRGKKIILLKHYPLDQRELLVSEAGPTARHFAQLSKRLTVLEAQVEGEVYHMIAYPNKDHVVTKRQIDCYSSDYEE